MGVGNRLRVVALGPGDAHPLELGQMPPSKPLPDAAAQLHVTHTTQLTHTATRPHGLLTQTAGHRTEIKSIVPAWQCHS